MSDVSVVSETTSRPIKRRWTETAPNLGISSPNSKRRPTMNPTACHTVVELCKLAESGIRSKRTSRARSTATGEEPQGTSSEPKSHNKWHDNGSLSEQKDPRMQSPSRGSKCLFALSAKPTQQHTPRFADGELVLSDTGTARKSQSQTATEVKEAWVTELRPIALFRSPSNRSPESIINSRIPAATCSKLTTEPTTFYFGPFCVGKRRTQAHTITTDPFRSTCEQMKKKSKSRIFTQVKQHAQLHPIPLVQQFELNPQSLQTPPCKPLMQSTHPTDGQSQDEAPQREEHLLPAAPWAP